MAGLMGDDLQGIVCHIVGCHGWSTGEEKDAEAEKVAKNHRSASGVQLDGWHY